MKAFRRNLFMPSLILMGGLTMVLFQNCSSDVGFDSAPTAGIADPVGDLGDNGGGDGDGGGNNKPPAVGGNSDVQIQLNQVPKDSTQDVSSVVDYEVFTPNGAIKTMYCTLNSVAVPCDPVDQITIAPLGVGTHQFTITATNTDDKTAIETITWSIYNGVSPKTKLFSVTSAADKVDIIINIDNSGSMKYEQESMAGRIKNFIAPFVGLDYHIAITTTSPIGAIVETPAPQPDVFVWKPELDYVDGKFVELDNAGTHCVKSTVHSQQLAEQLVEGNVVRSTNLLDDLNQILVVNGKSYPEGNGFERGIFTTYRAFERDITSSQPDLDCIRDGSVPKHVILISDEDETLFEEDSNNNVIGPALIDGDKSVGSNLVQYVSDEYGANTVFRFHSIIVNPYSAEGAACLASHGRIVGTDYAKLSRDTGGYIGSVCAEDYEDQMGAIGQVISDSRSTENLDCVAVPDENGNYGVVKDLATGLEIPIDYTFSGNKVDFTQMLGVGNYQVSYNCYD